MAIPLCIIMHLVPAQMNLPCYDTFFRILMYLTSVYRMEGDLLSCSTMDNLMTPDQTVTYLSQEGTCTKCEVDFYFFLLCIVESSIDVFHIITSQRFEFGNRLCSKWPALVYCPKAKVINATNL